MFLLFGVGGLIWRMKLYPLFFFVRLFIGAYVRILLSCVVNLIIKAGLPVRNICIRLPLFSISLQRRKYPMGNILRSCLRHYVRIIYPVLSPSYLGRSMDYIYDSARWNRAQFSIETFLNNERSFRWCRRNLGILGSGVRRRPL